MREAPSVSPLAAAEAMRGVVVYSRKFQMKLLKLNTICGQARGR